MINLKFAQRDSQSLVVLCLGAHSDDIEIGCGGTILRLRQEYPTAVIHWAVFTAKEVRENEARRASELFAGSQLTSCVFKSFADGFLPYAGGEVKQVFEKELKALSPDVIFTHNQSDAHQDHRLLSELTWNTFRNHFILEYEIPKVDGDLGRPSVFVPLEPEIYEKKLHYLVNAFPSQQNKPWFQRETFLSLMRIRGMECNAPSGYAEAFYCRKVVL